MGFGAPSAAPTTVSAPLSGSAPATAGRQVHSGRPWAPLSCRPGVEDGLQQLLQEQLVTTLKQEPLRGTWPTGGSINTARTGPWAHLPRCPTTSRVQPHRVQGGPRSHGAGAQGPSLPPGKTTAQGRCSPRSDGHPWWTSTTPSVLCGSCVAETRPPPLQGHSFPIENNARCLPQLRPLSAWTASPAGLTRLWHPGHGQWLCLYLAFGWSARGGSEQAPSQSRDCAVALRDKKSSGPQAPPSTRGGSGARGWKDEQPAWGARCTVPRRIGCAHRHPRELSPAALICAAARTHASQAPDAPRPLTSCGFPHLPRVRPSARVAQPHSLAGTVSREAPAGLDSKPPLAPAAGSGRGPARLAGRRAVFPVQGNAVKKERQPRGSDGTVGPGDRTRSRSFNRQRTAASPRGRRRADTTVLKSQREAAGPSRQPRPKPASIGTGLRGKGGHAGGCLWRER